MRSPLWKTRFLESRRVGVRLVSERAGEIPSLCPDVCVCPTTMRLRSVGLPGLEPGTSSLSEKHDVLPKGSRVCKTPANAHICCKTFFSVFQDDCLGCCTVAAHRGVEPSNCRSVSWRSSEEWHVGKWKQGQANNGSSFWSSSGMGSDALSAASVRPGC